MRAEGDIYLAPVHPVGCLTVFDNKPVFGRAAGKFTGMNDERSGVGELAHTFLNGMLRQLFGRQVPVGCPVIFEAEFGEISCGGY